MNQSLRATTFQPRDNAQREASERLLALHQRLLDDDSGNRPEPTGWLGRVRARLAKPASVEPVRGLYFWGGVGRGKTYLMDWFVEELELPGKRRLHFHHFMRDIHAALAVLPKQPDPLEVVADRLCAETRVLCLDEFLVTDITDAMILHGLLRALFARGLTLVTTANTKPSELYRNGLQRQSFLPAIALIEQHTEVFELDGGVDYRLRTLTQGGLLFESGAAGECQLTDYFARLTGGHVESVDAIEINDRCIPVRGLGMDVIWFDFASLCGTARSASDYIEIAKEYHTLLLSNVPRLDASQEAAARRFLHLIDELYDQRVKLVMSTAAPVERLYAGGLTEFAHERLISRLIEMQSLDYLAASADPG